MDPNTPLTIGFVALVAGVVVAFGGGGICIVLWLQRVLKTLRDELSREFRAEIAELGNAHQKASTEAIAKTLLEMKLWVAEGFMSKTTAVVINEKLLAEVHDMRTDLGARLQHIERRLMMGFGQNDPAE